MLRLFRENILIALGAIRSQILRTTLTVFIIGIGIMALVGILTVVSALEATLSADFASMGANTLNIERYSASERFQGHPSVRKKINPIISYPEARSFKERFDFPFTTTSVSFMAVTNAEVRYESVKTDPEIRVLGVDEHFAANSGLEISEGRNFSPTDISNNVPVAVIGADLVKALFKNEDPLGKTLSVRGAKFRVIGLLKGKGSTFGNREDLRMLIPIQLARSLYSAPNINYGISVMVGKKEMLEAATDKAMITMRQIRKLSPLEEDNFGLSRSDDLINRILSITQYLQIAAWVISIITIFGSSIALMNIMLVSVTERTREIGVRKALGATRRTIAMQFFIETLVIGQIGGLVGMFFGILLGFVVASLFEFGFAIPWMAILAAFAITFLVAVVSGSYPAVKASKLDPIEALRYE